MYLHPEWSLDVLGSLAGLSERDNELVFLVWQLESLSLRSSDAQCTARCFFNMGIKIANLLLKINLQRNASKCLSVDQMAQFELGKADLGNISLFQSHESFLPDWRHSLILYILSVFDRLR